MEYASKTEAINGADNTKIMTPLRVKQSILANGQGGGVVEEVDPIFKSSPAYNITDTDITNWNNNTYTAGTGINISSDNVISNTITNTSQLNNDSNFINSIKTINGQSLIGQGDIIIEGGIKEEADPVFTNSPAHTITQNDIEKWNSFSGGDSSEVVLYDNETGSSETITLSETSANFKYLEIFCKSVDNTYTSVKVYKPNGKRATVVSGWFASAAYFKLAVLTISGNTIALTKNTSEITGSNRCNTSVYANAISITRVVGYRN